MSCQDILLSFLADVGDGPDWAEHFQFVDFDADTKDLAPSPFSMACGLQSPSESCGRNVLAPISACSSPVYSSYSDSDHEDEMIKTISVEGWDFVSYENLILPYEEDEQRYCDGQKVPVSVLPNDEVPITLKKKRKLTDAGNDSRNKKNKQTVEDKMRVVCKLMKTVRELKKTKTKPNTPDPVGTAESLLNSFLTTKSANAKDLLNIFAPIAVLNSTGVSSLHTQAQLKRTQMQLNAWIPSIQPNPFPEKHSGVGQIAGAARTFMSSILDLLPIQVANKVHFSAALVKDSVVLSPEGDQLASQFSWRSAGLVALGQASEIEFNGLIRCSFGKDGVSSASISFDACALVRQCNCFVL